MFKQFLFIILNIHFVNCNLAVTYDEQEVNNAVGCLRQITRREFKFNPKGFMVMTKTYNLTRTADDIQNNYMRIVFESQRTAAMVIGDDKEDIFWRLNGGLAQEKHKDDGDEIGITTGEDVFIQSHLFFIRLSDFYVMIVDSYRMYTSKIRQLVRVPSWNARAPMVIYCSAIVKTRARMLLYPRHILHSLWSYHVMNVVVLVHDYTNRSIINLYSWNPYDPPHRCGEKHQQTQNHLKIYDTCSGGNLTKLVKLFPDKAPKNLKGCPIKVIGVIWHPFLNHNKSDDDPGHDREILNVIAERVNFSIKLDTGISYWGDRMENGSWDGLFGGLKHGRGEVAIGALYPDIDVHEDFDATLSYLQDSYVWVVPRAREIPKWENLVIILKPNLWLASGIVYIICTLVWFAFTKIPWERGITLKELVPSILDSWCMNLCISTVFRPDSDTFRIYFIFFCLYSMIWSTAYQTKLITILTHPTYEKPITSVKDMLKANLKFGGNEAFRFLFNNSIDKIEDYFHTNYLEMDVHEVLNHVIHYRNVSVLTSKQYVRYLSSVTTSYNDQHGIPLFSLVTSNVFSFPVEIVTIKGFAFLDQFNGLLARLKSNGLVNLFHQRFKIQVKRKAANLALKLDIHEEETLKLNVENLQGAFIAVVLGNVTALLIFIAEVIVNKKRENEKRKLIAEDRKRRWGVIREEVVGYGYGRRNKGRIRYNPKKEFLRLAFGNNYVE